MNSFIKTFTQSRMGIEDALGLELFCCLVYKRFTEYRETRFKSPTEKLTIRQYIVYQQPIHPPHLEGMILTSPFFVSFLWKSGFRQSIFSQVRFIHL